MLAMSARQQPLEPAVTAPPGGGKLLTADEVALRLRVAKGWVYAETRAGRLPHVRLGRYVRYRDAAIDRWLARLEGDSVLTSAGPGRAGRRAAPAGGARTQR